MYAALSTLECDLGGEVASVLFDEEFGPAETALLRRRPAGVVGALLERLGRVLRATAASVGGQRAVVSTACLRRQTRLQTICLAWDGAKEDEIRLLSPEDVVPVPGTERIARKARPQDPLIICSRTDSAFNERELLELETRNVRWVLYLPLWGNRILLGLFAVELANRTRPGRRSAMRAFGACAVASKILGLLETVAQAEVAAVAQERNRLAQEFHDSVAQAFVGIGMLLRQCAHAEDPTVLRAKRLAEQGLADVRRAMHDLGPSQLLMRPFAEAVRQLGESMVSGAMTFELLATGLWPSLSRDTESQLFRVIQEAVGNAVKHSSASSVTVEISCTEREATILVSDDGCGFDRADAQLGVGFGLLSMRRRVASMGARMELHSALQRGTAVLITLPCGARRVSPRDAVAVEDGQ